MTDIYVSALSSILKGLEEIYSVKEIDPRNTMHFVELKKNLELQLKSMDKKDIEKRNKDAGEKIVLLTYIIAKMKFYGYVRLTYNSYPSLAKIVPALVKFTQKSTITPEAYKEVTKIVILINEIDKRQVQLKTQLSYRYLRMFVILIINRNLAAAAVFADLILNQMVVR